MSGLFDKIFSGEKGIANKLAGLAKSNAILIRNSGAGAYNPETDEYEQGPQSAETVPFVPETAKFGSITHVGGVQVQSGDLVGIIPGAKLENPIAINADDIRFGSVLYRIIATENIMSGEQVALVRILGRRS